jgi:D-serine deaminase-like pyridoxal phosphate-dependent protein
LPAPPIDPRRYAVENADQVLTPSLVVYPDIVHANIDRALAWAEGNPARLRPHAKTHKTAEIIEMELDRGITKHKCATLYEADLLAKTGAPDILIGYPMVGPNIGRLIELQHRYAGRSTFRVLVDHAVAVDALAHSLEKAKQSVAVLIDLDAGMGRTGIAPGEEATKLARQIAANSSLLLDGLHLYDGDVDHPSADNRRERVEQEWKLLVDQTDRLEKLGLPVNRMVVAGTGTFAAWLEVAKKDARLEASPGTFVFSDWNYHERFADLGMTPAAVLFTRVVSRPRGGRLTCDLGHKAVAADPMKEERVHFLDIASWTFVRQNEEHLVIESPEADRFMPGDLLMALPYHICPTCALHRDMYVARHGKVTGQWRVAGRDRVWD